MKVYFISGLGADKRVFKHIRLPEGFEPVYLDWITPEKNESLQAYSLRLAEKIDSHEKFAILGLSMGGMIASEISKEYSPAVTILLSSVPCSKQLPTHFKIAYTFRLHKFLPIRLLKSATLIKRLFTTETAEDKQTLRQVIRDSDPRFISWALTAILQWKNDIIPQPLLQIHGTKDEILPLRFTSPTHTIENGTHMMVMGKAGELNLLLREALLTMEHGPS